MNDTHLHGSFRAYLVGFFLSLLCTGLAFGIVQFQLSNHSLSLEAVVPLVLIFSLGQFIAQLVCFFHLWRGRRGGWNVSVLLFAICIVGILVGGTLWIMNNLQGQHLQETFIGGEISPQSQTD